MKREAKPNECETLLGIHLNELGVSFEPQFPVCVERRWKFDFYLPEYRIAIEIDGFFKGRHGKGWGGDYEKQNWGTMLGFRILRFSTQEVKKGTAKAFLQEWLKKNGSYCERRHTSCPINATQRRPRRPILPIGGPTSVSCSIPAPSEAVSSSSGMM